MFAMASAPPVGRVAPLVDRVEEGGELVVVGGVAGDGVFARRAADPLAERVAEVRQAGVVELDAAVGGLDPEAAAERPVLDVGKQGRGNAAGKAQLGLDAGVRAELAEPRRGGDDLGLGAHEAAQPVQRVAAEIHHRPAALQRVIADVLRIPGDVDAELGLKRTHGAEPGLQREQPQERRVIAVVEGLHQHALAGVGGGDHRARLVGGHRDRLLAEHVLAGGERLDRPLRVAGGRKRVVDEVGGGIGEQRFVAGIGNRDIVLVGIGDGGRRAARGHRGDDDVVAPRGRGDDGAGGDPCGAENADTVHAVSVRSQRGWFRWPGRDAGRGAGGLRGERRCAPGSLCPRAFARANPAPPSPHPRLGVEGTCPTGGKGRGAGRRLPERGRAERRARHRGRASGDASAGVARCRDGAIRGQTVSDWRRRSAWYCRQSGAISISSMRLPSGSCSQDWRLPSRPLPITGFSTGKSAEAPVSVLPQA